MHSLVHASMSIVGGVVLFRIGVMSMYEAIVFSLWGFFIDIDHLLFFSIKHKARTMIQYLKYINHYAKRMQPNLYIFHSPEFIGLLALLSIFFQETRAILLSTTYHVSLDILAHLHHDKSFSFMKRWSVLVAAQDLIKKR